MVSLQNILWLVSKYLMVSPQNILSSASKYLMVSPKNILSSVSKYLMVSYIPSGETGLTHPKGEQQSSKYLVDWGLYLSNGQILVTPTTFCL
jgi:hypothetical protein